MFHACFPPPVPQPRRGRGGSFPPCVPRVSLLQGRLVVKERAVPGNAVLPAVPDSGFAMLPNHQQADLALRQTPELAPPPIRSVVPPFLKPSLSEPHLTV
jgi:hypothetical protein